MMYQFPLTVIINYHKLPSLKQHKFITYGSRGQEFDMGLTDLNPGVGTAGPSRSSRENSF